MRKTRRAKNRRVKNTKKSTIKKGGSQTNIDTKMKNLKDKMHQQWEEWRNNVASKTTTVHDIPVYATIVRDPVVNSSSVNKSGPFLKTHKLTKQEKIELVKKVMSTINIITSGSQNVVSELTIFIKNLIYELLSTDKLGSYEDVNKHFEVMLSDVLAYEFMYIKKLEDINEAKRYLEDLNIELGSQKISINEKKINHLFTNENVYFPDNEETLFFDNLIDMCTKQKSHYKATYDKLQKYIKNCQVELGSHTEKGGVAGQEDEIRKLNDQISTAEDDSSTNQQNQQTYENIIKQVNNLLKKYKELRVKAKAEAKAAEAKAAKDKKWENARNKKAAAAEKKNNFNDSGDESSELSDLYDSELSDLED